MCQLEFLSRVKDHPYITSAKDWVVGYRKWPVLLTFSSYCIYADFAIFCGGLVRKSPKSCWCKIWIVPYRTWNTYLLSGSFCRLHFFWLRNLPFSFFVDKVVLSFHYLSCQAVAIQSSNKSAPPGRGKSFLSLLPLQGLLDCGIFDIWKKKNYKKMSHLFDWLIKFLAL